MLMFARLAGRVLKFFKFPVQPVVAFEAILPERPGVVVANTVETTQDEFSRKYGAALRVVGAAFLFTLLLVALSFAGVLVGSRSFNPTIVGTLRIIIVFLGVGAVIFRRTRFSVMRLQDIAALRGEAGLLETLYSTTAFVALIGGAIALAGFVITMMTVWTDMLWLGGIAVIVLLYAYPRRSAWAKVVRATTGEDGEAGRAVKGTIV
jgi:hypothetical protein